MFFEPLQGWGLHHLPGQPGPVPDHFFSEEIFPDIEPKPPLTQHNELLGLGWGCSVTKFGCGNDQIKQKRGR